MPNDPHQYSCSHKCHKVGLNPWIRCCPICGCKNPDYDPNAKVPDDFFVAVRMPVQWCEFLTCDECYEGKLPLTWTQFGVSRIGQHAMAEWCPKHSNSASVEQNDALWERKLFGGRTKREVVSDAAHCDRCDQDINVIALGSHTCVPKTLEQIADVVLNYRPKSKQPKPRKRKKAAKRA